MSKKFGEKGKVKPEKTAISSGMSEEFIEHKKKNGSKYQGSAEKKKRKKGITQNKPKKTGLKIGAKVSSDTNKDGVGWFQLQE